MAVQITAAKAAARKGEKDGVSASNAVVPATIAGSPTNVVGSAGNGQVSLTFTAPTSNGGSAVTGYTATSSPGGVTGASVGSATSIIVSGLTNGVSYTFTVTATNGAGSGAASSARDTTLTKTGLFLP